jgi:hypothetical protein
MKKSRVGEGQCEVFWFEKSLPRRVVRTRRRQAWQPGLRTCTTAQAAALLDRLTEQLFDRQVGPCATIMVTIASPGNGNPWAAKFARKSSDKGPARIAAGFVAGSGRGALLIAPRLGLNYRQGACNGPMERGTDSAVAPTPGACHASARCRTITLCREHSPTEAQAMMASRATQRSLREESILHRMEYGLFFSSFSPLFPLVKGLLVTFL